MKVEHRIGRCIQLGGRKARYFGSKKLAFQIAIIATVANLTLAVSRSGLEGPWFILSALMLLVVASWRIAPPANMRTKIESQWAAISALTPPAPKIATCRPLF